MGVLFPTARRAATNTAARRAVVSRRKAAYVLISCGHLTTEDVREQFSFAAPTGKPYFCERCNGYFSKPRVSRKRAYPDQPPFLHDDRCHASQRVSLGR